MNRILVTAAFSFALMAIADAIAQTPEEQPNAVSIPLKEIWAFSMPGTQDVRSLEPKVGANLSEEELTKRFYYWKILNRLRSRPKDGKNAGPAFVVVGTGKEALKNASDVFAATKDARPTILPPDTDLSLVFYSHSCGRYVRLVAVEKSPNVITLKYRFVAHLLTTSTSHFALIPLGKLPEGKVEVKIEQLPPTDEQGQPVPPLKDPLRFVCDSFSFAVEKR